MVLLAALYALTSSSEFQWDLPEGFPTPFVPEDNPMTVEKVEMGRNLFYDKRLSRDESMSCASCHKQDRAFTDGFANARGIPSVGDIHPRNAQHLGNVGYAARLNWANPTVSLLEEQSRGPIFADGAPIIELGLTTSTLQENALSKIRSDETYTELLSRAFPDSDEITFKEIRYALAAFQRTLITGRSSFDVYYYDSDRNALTESQIAGADLFFGEKAECFHCHGGFNFTDTNLHDQTVFDEVFYHANGIKSDTDYTLVPDNEKGIYTFTADTADIGKFRAPSLRNVALTYPYMHDGSFTCADFTEGENWRKSCAREALGKVIDNYSSGGLDNSNIDTSLIRAFSLTTAERDAMVDFLFSLTDNEFIKAEKFSNPRPGNPLFGP